VRSWKSEELPFLPKPLSGIAWNPPSPASSTAEMPPTGWPSKGGVRPPLVSYSSPLPD
jgi:hypothetical protein